MFVFDVGLGVKDVLKVESIDLSQLSDPVRFPFPLFLNSFFNFHRWRNVSPVSILSGNSKCQPMSSIDTILNNNNTNNK